MCIHIIYIYIYVDIHTIFQIYIYMFINIIMHRMDTNSIVANMVNMNICSTTKHYEAAGS